MSDTIISVERLSKRYRLGQIGATTMRESVERWLAGIRNARRSREVAELPSCQVVKSGADSTQQPTTNNLTTDDADLWALRDVSFEVKRGEVLGIIGRNGAGKSTLLKILSRITEPTSGRAIMRGRVASLLEVGTGFHPELTGRENIYLNGAILGMRHREITAKFDEIVAFSEVERFIDTPVKRYSSGMYVRLAFAVAAHLDPEILLVDEVLAVGDAAFQKKCLGKMEDVAKHGRTVLFVSHNMGAIAALCETSIWLEKGEVLQHWNTRDIVRSYLAGGNEKSLRSREWSNWESAPGDQYVRIYSASVMSKSEDRLLATTSAINLTFGYWVKDTVLPISLSVILKNDAGQVLFNTAPDSASHCAGEGCYEATVCIPENLLNDGRIYVDLYVVMDRTRCLYREENILSFDVVDDPHQRECWFGKYQGIIRPKLQWSTTRL